MLELLMEIEGELSLRHRKACVTVPWDYEARADVVKYLEEKYIVNGKWTSRVAQGMSKNLGGQQ